MVSATGSVTEGKVWKPQVFMDSLLSGSKEMQSLRLPNSLSFGVSGEIPQGIVEWAGGGRIESDKPSTSRQVWSRNLIVGLWWRPYPFTLRFTSEICPRTIDESLQECDSERTVSTGAWTACRSVGWEFWSDGYYAATVGERGDWSVVEEYVRSQGVKKKESLQLWLF